MAQLLLGVITNNERDVFQRGVIAGIREIAEQQGCAVRVHSLAEQPDSAPNLSDVHGVLAIANSAPELLLTTINRMGIPISLVSHQVFGLPIPVVISNNTEGIGELVRHLVNRCGRRKLVFIRGLMDQNDGLERERAFRQELIRCNLHVPETHYLRGNFSPEIAADSLRQFIEGNGSFDGIVASDYVMASAAVEVLRAARIAVPEAVSVVGFGDAPEAEAAGLTTVAANISELGACAARQLISQIKGARITGITTLSVRLVIRETCGCSVGAR